MPFTSQLGTIDSILGSLQQMGGVSGAPESGDQNRNASNTLGFAAQEAVYDPVINILAANVLGLSAQEAAALYRAVSQSLFTFAGSNPDSILEVGNFLGFTDRKFFSTGNVLLSRISNPGIVQEAVLVTAMNLFFTNPSVNNSVIDAHNADNLFGFIDAISSATFVNPSNTFTLSDVIASTGSSERAPGNSGFLKQSLSFSIEDDRCREVIFDPLIGESDDESFGVFLTTAPTIIPTQAGITLTYPLVNPSNTLLLEIPNFGNEDTWNFTRIDRTTRGNDRKIFSDPKWAKFERLTFEMFGNTADCTAGIDEIIAFLNVSLMKEIGFTDWEGRTWKGFIVAPETEVTETADGFSLQIVFEGVLTVLEVQHGELNVIHGQDVNGEDIEVIYSI